MAPCGAYMVLDDDQGTAYIFDNVAIDSPATLFCDDFETANTSTWSATVGGP